MLLFVGGLPVRLSPCLAFLQKVPRPRMSTPALDNEVMQQLNNITYVRIPIGDTDL